MGLVQGEKAPASSLHSKVEPTSLEVKEKEAELEPEGSVGSEVMVVSGAAVSTVHVDEAGGASWWEGVSIELS